MKILIDIRPLARGLGSGIPNYTREITSRLTQQSSDQFELFYPGLRNQNLPDSWRNHPHISVLNWKIPGRLLDLAQRWLHKPDLSKKTDADIILSPHLNNLIAGTLPRVLTIHDLSFAHHSHFFSRRQRIWHQLQNWQEQIKRASHLIAVSHYTKEDIIRTLHISPENISVIYPGISEQFKPIDPHDEHLLQFQRRHSIVAPYFLYLGALEARKNIPHLVAAFDALRTNPRFKGYQLILAGTPGHGARHIVTAVRQSNSSSAIKIISRVTDEDRVFLYNGAVAFVCTSFFEGFGFPPLEAQACGVPVIASNRTSFIEILGDSALLVDPWKSTDLTVALTTLGSDEKVRAQLIQRGIVNSRRFNWEETTNQIYTILTKTKRTPHATT